MNRVLPALLIWLVLGCASDPPHPELTFDEAYRRALEDSDPLYEPTVKKEIGERVLGATISCGLPKGKKVSVVVAISASGRIAEIYVDPPTKKNRCLKNRFVKTPRFDRPPKAPFFVTPSFNFLLEE